MGPDSTARGFPWEGGAYQGGSREGSGVWDEKPGFLLKKTTVWGILDWIADRGIQMHTCTYGFENISLSHVKMLCQKYYITDVCNQQTDRILQKNIVSQTYAACSPRAIMCFDRSWRFFFPFSCFSLIFAFESWFRFCANRIQKLL